VLGCSPTFGNELTAYEKLRCHHDIGPALVVGYEGEPAYAGNNEYVLSLARTHPWMAPLAYLRVRPAPTVGRLRSFRAAGAAGFAIYLPREDDGRAFAAWPKATVDELCGQGCVVSLNAPPAVLELLGAALDALEGCSILVSHLGLPGRLRSVPSAARAREHLAPVLALASRGHVAVKLSGLYSVSEPHHDFPHAAAQPLVDAVLESFGPQRLLWGSDFSPALDFVSFAQLVDRRWVAGCSPEEIELVMGGNLSRLLETRPRSA
jgi:predicted TIM-barrel fold metal-dependent hydrolase